MTWRLALSIAVECVLFGGAVLGITVIILASAELMRRRWRRYRVRRELSKLDRLSLEGVARMQRKEQR
jgi:hypothetical protein